MFRKRVAPAIGKIEDRDVRYKHGVMLARASLEDLAQPVPEIVFALFRFHCDFVSLQC
jgi:hypothetical protein